MAPPDYWAVAVSSCTKWIKERQNVYTELAINGGAPAKQRPDPPMFPGGMLIGQAEEESVLDTLRSKRLFRYYGPEKGP